MKKVSSVLLILPIVSLLVSCAPKQEGNQETVRKVKVTTAISYGNTLRTTFPGKIKASSNIDLAFRVAGKIERIPVKAGDFVRKGQVIAQLDPRDYEIQLSATEAEYKQIKGEVERIVELYQRESVSKNDYEKAVYGLEQITAKYNAHKNALADTRLTAPFDGYIQEILFHEQETVAAGMGVLEMINNASPEIEINIPAAAYLERENFESFSCQVSNFPDKEFPLDLVGITHMANLNQLYTVTLKMKPDGSQLPTPGVSAMVTIRYKTEGSENVSIPITALVQSGGETSVWKYEGGTVTRRVVNPVEIKTDGTIIVTGGIAAGDEVVSAGVSYLKEGQRVDKLEAASGTNVGGLL